MEEDKVYSAKNRRALKERLVRVGLEGFLDYEVLELLLSYSMPRKGTRFLAESLLEYFGNYQNILDASFKELISYPGMNADAAIMLKLPKDCSAYYFKKRVINRKFVACGKELIKYCQISMAGLKNEQFRVAFLNTHSKIIEIETMQEGTINEITIYPRKILERALYHRATALIFVHNHISGNPKPSKADKDLTEVLVNAASSLEIEVYDHIIIGNNDYFSFRDYGLL